MKAKPLRINYYERYQKIIEEYNADNEKYKIAIIFELLMNLAGIGMELTFEDLFSKFAENYWNLITKYHLKQLRIVKGLNSLQKMLG